MPPRVLAIEPDPMIAEFYRDLLSQEGYEVLVLSQPVTDPSTIAALQADLIILELLVGWEMNGPQFIEKLRTSPTTAATPVIVCTTALHLLPQAEPILAAYKVPVISKPFHIDHFLGVVQQILPSAPQHV